LEEEVMGAYNKLFRLNLQDIALIEQAGPNQVLPHF
jgi:hypothetical protein